MTLRWLIVAGALLSGAAPLGMTQDSASQPAPPAEDPLVRLRAERRQFQAQEVISAKPLGYIFSAGDPPRVIWRDAEEVRRLGADPQLQVRWFDAQLNEAAVPDHPGRWGAVIEGRAPNGTPVRRALTFFCRPEGFLFLTAPEAGVPGPQRPGPIPPAVWDEHADEIGRVARDLYFRALNDSEAGAILLAGLSEASPLDRAATGTDSAAVRNDDFHLALKLKLAGADGRVRSLRPPRVRAGGPAPVLRPGTAAEAGVAADAAARIAAVCEAWAADSGEPFVTLVARNGVIVLHAAFGRAKDGGPLPLDFRHDVFSITKTATAMLFSQFVDQELIDLDDSLAEVFPDYPAGSPHVPTFRQCLTHTSGLSGHGDWGGVRNAYLDNIILNGIDALQPGQAYAYSSTGFDLTAEAMETVTGRSALRLYREHLFEPLGLGDVPMVNAGSGARLTAFELGVWGQWLANRGSYGELEFITPATFERLLPEPLGQRYPGLTEVEGIGMHWMKDRRPGAAADSLRPEDRVFSARAVGHGSLSSCILRADLETGLVISQIRATGGPRFGEWSARFFATVVDSLRPETQSRPVGPASGP